MDPQERKQDQEHRQGLAESLKVCWKSSMQRLLSGEEERALDMIFKAMTTTGHEDPQYVTTDLGSIAFA